MSIGTLKVQKRVSDSLELEVQVVVSCLIATENQIGVLSQTSVCSQLLRHPSTPIPAPPHFIHKLSEAVALLFIGFLVLCQNYWDPGRSDK